MCSQKFNIFLLLLLTTIGIQAQQRTLEFGLFDQDTKLPVDNAHVFLANTTFGAYSNFKGRVDFEIPNTIYEDLIISHIGYDVMLIDFDDYQKFAKDSIFLKPNPVEIAELVITAKRGKKWKKQFKKFREAFIGKNKVAKKCKILNPEVLRFEEKNGALSAYAVDLLHLRNEHSGYKIQYWLSSFNLKKDGSIEYSGKSSFEDIAREFKEKKVIKNREKLFAQSPKHFFQALISDQLRESGYEITNVRLENNVFVRLPDLVIDSFVRKSGTHYHIIFPDFLKVVNKKLKDISLDSEGMQVGGLESQRFTGSRTVEKASLRFATSYIYKLKPYLLLNRFGNVLNSHEVKEYGFWADQKVAHQLPFDYGDDYSITDHIADQDIKADAALDRRLQLLYTLLYENNKDQVNAALAELNQNWDDELILSMVEIMRLRREEWLVQKINDILVIKAKTRKLDFYEWLQWLWSKDEIEHKLYAEFKANVYQNIDPKFKTYFSDRDSLFKIRLDEIVWGGVKQDGIPPLRMPHMIPAYEADYLDDEDVVFGFYINGEARAYPKRILAWHEFVVDEFAGAKITGVYCTLCGTVIAYAMTHDGVFHDLGTSGFLYRSNKLMYDRATQSLWSTIEGKPVVGPLVDQGIELKTYPVVTTTWLDWKNAHLDTKVLSLDTGHDRDYGEGVAYAAYFETDELMFPVPQVDHALKNKAEVMIVRVDGYQNDPLAVSMDYLKSKGLLQAEISGNSILYMADANGLARAYLAKEVVFKSYKNGKILDDQGHNWKVTEQALIHPDGTKLNRVPSHNIFWFAWLNAYPETRLVK